MREKLALHTQRCCNQPSSALMHAGGMIFAASVSGAGDGRSTFDILFPNYLKRSNSGPIGFVQKSRRLAEEETEKRRCNLGCRDRFYRRLRYSRTHSETVGRHPGVEFI